MADGLRTDLAPKLTPSPDKTRKLRCADDGGTLNGREGFNTLVSLRYAVVPTPMHYSNQLQGPRRVCTRA